MTSLFRITGSFVLVLAMAVAGRAQGVELKRGAMVLVGSAANCTQPAEIDYKKVRDKTPEWKTIRAEGVPADSARYDLLVSEMNKRIKAASRKVAEDAGNDCVLCKGDVVDARGQQVADVTDKVIEQLETDAGRTPAADLPHHD
jgi:hypothetical protein